MTCGIAVRGSRRDLEDGKIIAVHKVTDLDAEIRERIRPDMTDQEKRQLAEWCASKKDLLPVGVWLEAIEIALRKKRRRKTYVRTKSCFTRWGPCERGRLIKQVTEVARNNVVIEGHI